MAVGKRGIGLALVASAGLHMTADGAQGPVMVQQAYLKAPVPDAADGFGEALATDGDTLVVGTYLEDGASSGVNGAHTNTLSAAGAAYVYVRRNGAWELQAYLKASNPGANDQFGRSVAISGDTIVVGADGEGSNATGVNGNQANNSAGSAGAAYVFVRENGIWSQQAYLKASNSAASDGFGRAVAIDGDIIAIGATGEDSAANGIDGNQHDNAASGAGAVYVFVRDQGQWTQQAYLKASNTGGSDQFGGGVAISGETLVVGAEFEDSNATGVNGDQADNSAANAGAAYVFVRSGGTWSQQAYLKQSNTGVGLSSFGGRNVAIDGDRIAIGAPLEDSGATNSGAVYVFDRTAGAWAETAMFKASSAATSDNFGSGVAVSNGIVVAGAAAEDGSTPGVNGAVNDSANGAGAAYVFQFADGAWMQLAYVKASNPGASDQFGLGVTASGARIVVGAPGEDSAAAGVNGDQTSNSASGSGAAYIFSVAGLNEAPTANGGDDRFVEVTSAAGALVTLDGSHSIDPDGDALVYRWVDSDGNPLAATAVTQVALPIGTHTFHLSVDDGNGGVSGDEVTITVADTTAPVIEIASPTPASYPFGSSLVAQFTCADQGTGIATCVGSVESGASVATTVGGSFLFTVSATDHAGNSTSVSVPYTVVNPCPAGSYRAEVSDIVCTPAPPGSFVPTTGATSATLCPAGSFSAEAGATACTPAPAGSFVPIVGATSATLCAAGSSSASSGAASCTPAPAGSFVSTTGATSAALCPAGAFSASTGATSCTPSPAGSFVSTVGATAATLCAAGSFSAESGATTCTPAPANHYVPTAGATAAIACPAGTTSSVGATQCTDTIAPTISGMPADITVNALAASGAAVTYATPAATDLVDGSVVVTCVPSSGATFPVGTTPVNCSAADAAGNSASAIFNVTVRPPCAAGSYLATPDAATCTPAPPGSFVPSIGATSATLCAAGSFSAESGATACTPAPAGSFVSTAGATSAMLCTAGSFSASSGAASCTPAPAGSFVSTTGATSATSCPTGAFSASTGATSCTPSPAGSFVSTTGATTATLCAAGSFSAESGATTCTPAPANHYVPTAGATAPIACPAGTTSSVGATQCTDTIAPTISGVPADITVNALAASGAAVSYTAPTSTDLVDGSVAVTCIPTSGATFPVGTTPVNCSATDAAGNSASAIFNVTVRPPCAAGSYLASPDAGTCTPAPPGSFVPTTGATSATLCPAGSFSAEAGATACTPAPAGSFVSTAGATSAMLCTAGSFSASSGATSCTAAPTGSFVSTTGATSATLCPAGAFSASTGATSCTPSPAGSFVSTTGATTATLCAAGSFSAESGATTCTPAPANHYVPTAGETAPIACPAGTTSSVGATQCTDTIAPTISGVPADITVNALAESGAAVTYATPTATDLVDGSVAVTCVPTSGATFPVGMTPVNCSATDAAGNSASATFNVTVRPPCAAGSYLATPDAATCTPAPPGSFVPTTGATSATLCPAGSFSAEAGATACTPAPAGSFVSTAGATSAMLCTAGSFSASSGATSCAPSPAGSFVSTAGAMSATLCPAGAFSASTGATSCSPSPAGSFVSTAGATSATLCAAGSFSAAAGATACAPAPANHYVPTAGATAPIACPVGTTSSVGATQCTDTIAPTISGVPTDVSVTASSTAGVVVNYTTPTASDPGFGSVPVSCVPTSGSTFGVGTTTVTCTATDAAGHSSTATFHVTVAPLPDPDPEPEPEPGMPGEMRGDGYVRDGGDKYEFQFHVKETERRGESGRFKLTIEHATRLERDSRGRWKTVRPADDKFEATSITSIVFSDDPNHRPTWFWWWRRPHVDTVEFSGTGKWNGRAGYTFEVRAEDHGEPGRHREAIAIVIRNSAGEIVAQVSGDLDGGNVQSKRIKH